jgi:hypothetical protein
MYMNRHLLFLLFFLNGLYSRGQTVDNVEKADPKARIIEFLKCYKNDHKALSELYKLRFFENAYPDSSNVRIDFTGADRYVDSFYKSGFVSDRFTSALKKVFVSIDERLKHAPQKEKYIDDFSIDLVLHTFDTGDILDNIENAAYEVLKTDGNKALVKARFTEATTELFMLSQINNIWYVDKLEWPK